MDGGDRRIWTGRWTGSWQEAGIWSRPVATTSPSCGANRSFRSCARRCARRTTEASGKKSVGLCHEILELDPEGSADLAGSLFQTLYTRIRDRDRALAFGFEIVEGDGPKHPSALGQIAYVLVFMDEPRDELSDALAELAAQEADRLGGGKLPSPLETLAHLSFERGDVRGAIAFQRRRRGRRAFGEDAQDDAGDARAVRGGEVTPQTKRQWKYNPRPLHPIPSLSVHGGPSMLSHLAIALLGFSASTPTSGHASRSGVLAFGPDGVLFVADPKAAAVFAFETDDKASSSREGIVVAQLDAELAALVGSESSELVIHDIAVHPNSGAAYVSFSRGRGPDADPVLARVPAAGDIEILDLGGVKSTRVELPNAPKDEGEGRRNQAALCRSRTWSSTKGRCTWRASRTRSSPRSCTRSPTPFARSAAAARSATAPASEIYHGAHGAWETRAPVRTFTTCEIEDTDHLLGRVHVHAAGEDPGPRGAGDERGQRQGARDHRRRARQPQHAAGHGWSTRREATSSFSWRTPRAAS